MLGCDFHSIAVFFLSPVLLSVTTQSTHCLSYIYAQSVMCYVIGDVTEVNRYSFMSLWKRSYKSCKGNKLGTLQRYESCTPCISLCTIPQHRVKNGRLPHYWELLKKFSFIFICGLSLLWTTQLTNDFNIMPETLEGDHQPNLGNCGKNMLRSKMIWIIYE